jgi:hypothetical protein
LLQGEVSTESKDLALVNQVKGFVPFSGPRLCNRLLDKLDSFRAGVGEEISDEISANVGLLLGDRAGSLAQILQPNTCVYISLFLHR